MMRLNGVEAHRCVQAKGRSDAQPTYQPESPASEAITQELRRPPSMPRRTSGNVEGWLRTGLLLASLVVTSVFDAVDARRHAQELQEINEDLSRVSAQVEILLNVIAVPQALQARGPVRNKPKD